MRLCSLFSNCGGNGGSGAKNGIEASAAHIGMKDCELDLQIPEKIWQSLKRVAACAKVHGLEKPLKRLGIQGHVYIGQDGGLYSGRD